MARDWRGNPPPHVGGYGSSPRNSAGGWRGDFQEVFPDEGDIDMLAALRAYKESGCSGMVEPDRVPGKNRETIVFAYGYIRGLLQTVYEGDGK